MMFSNIELLYNFHCIFLQDLQEAVKASVAMAKVAAANAALAAGNPLPVPGAAAAAATAEEAATASSPAAESSTSKKTPKPALTVSDLILKFSDFFRMFVPSAKHTHTHTRTQCSSVLERAQVSDVGESQCTRTAVGRRWLT